MSATERLRILLDDQGIEWDAPATTVQDVVTMWQLSDELDAEAYEDESGEMELTITSIKVTPARAVELSRAIGKM